MNKKMCVVLSAGGKGVRMNSKMPKQFLLLNDKPLALHSFELFASLEEVVEIVVVCSKEYQEYFQTGKSHGVKISFAEPGNRRQDSVYNGLKGCTSAAEFICVHDAVRPFITKSLVQRVLVAAEEYGAAAAGVAVKSTVKETDASGKVLRTLDRASLWEVQTPQIIRRDLLEKAFMYAYQNDLQVTDDVSLIELLGLHVQLVEGGYQNLKITTPEDMELSHMYCKKADHVHSS